MIPRWINYTQGAPISADFATAGGFGPSLCIDQTTGTLYYLNSSGVPTAISGGGGGVTSVGLSMPTGFSVAGSPVTAAGTLAVTTTLNGYLKGNGSGFAAVASVPAGDVTGLAAVATTGAYSSLSGTPSLAAIATSGSAADLSSGTIPAARMPALTGDVTTTAGAVATTITAGAVSLSKMANLAANSLIGNNTGSSAVPLALTTAQVTAMLDVVASGAKGLAPASGGGTTNFLRADGTWAVPPGTGGGGVPTSRVIATTAPLAGGGDLTADRTLSITAATSSAAGSMSAADKVKLDNFLAPVCMSADAAAIGPAITDYFASTLSLEASSTYDIECYVSFLKTTAGTITWTWNCSSAPTMLTSRNQSTPITGYSGATVTGAPVQAQATSKAVAATAHAASGSLTTAVDHSWIFWVRIRTNAATTIQLRATGSAGTITPRAGSYMRAFKVG